MAVVGLDLDGVVYHFTKTFTEWMNSRTDIKLFDPNIEAQVWDWFTPQWNMSRDEFVIQMEMAVHAKKLFWNAELYEADIPEQVRRLRKAGHKIEVVTHRFTPGSSDATWDCLLRDRIYPCGVTFSKDKTSVKTDYFLEDNVANYDALINAGVDAFLINRPYNQQFDQRARIDSFKEFVDWVLFMEGNPPYA